LWWGHLAHLVFAGLDLWLGCCKNILQVSNFWAQILPFLPSISPINILLVHTIILQYVHMMLIDGCDGVIWPIWYLLGWICGWGVVKTSCKCPTSESKSCHSCHPDHQSISC
jgi:hypothetical protein